MPAPPDPTSVGAARRPTTPSACGPRPGPPASAVITPQGYALSNSKSAARPAPSGESTRQSFADIAPVLDFPDFLEIQLRSYHDFVQAELVPEERDPKKGLEADVPGALPDHRHARALHARVPPLHAGGAQALHRGVPRAGPHVRPPAQGQAPPERQGGRGRGRAGGGDPAGRLPRQPARHDRQGHVRRQRRRAGHRQPAPPEPGRVLLAERPPQRDGPLQCPRDPLPGLLDRVLDRRRQRDVGLHRPEEEAAGHDAPPRPRLLVRQRDRRPVRPRRRGDPFDQEGLREARRPHAGLLRHGRGQARGDRRGHRRGAPGEHGARGGPPRRARADGGRLRPPQGRQRGVGHPPPRDERGRRRQGARHVDAPQHAQEGPDPLGGRGAPAPLRDPPQRRGARRRRRPARCSTACSSPTSATTSAPSAATA